MSNKILFIFEGAKKEKQITDNLTQFFIHENTVVTCAYCTTIYKMYAEIIADQDLDTFSLLKSMAINKAILNDYKRSDFAEIYMFFDYDGHTNKANDEKMRQLLAFFNEETDKGKLYISYPMVEALKHIADFDTFKDLKVNCKIEKYKQLVNIQCISDFIDFNVYTLDIWKKIIPVHLKKANYITNNDFVFPTKLIEQTTLFAKQFETYISKDQTIAVVSAFPLFLNDYYGYKNLKERLSI